MNLISWIFGNLLVLFQSLIDVAIIDVTAVGMAFTFYKVNRVAGALIIPYCLWLGFITAFNYRLYKDNKEEQKKE